MIRFASGKEAGQLGFYARAISRILNRPNWRTHKGFHWFENVPPFAEPFDDTPREVWSRWINSQEAICADPGVLDQRYNDLPAGGLPAHSQET